MEDCLLIPEGVDIHLSATAKLHPKHRRLTPCDTGTYFALTPSAPGRALGRHIDIPVESREKKYFFLREMFFCEKRPEVIVVSGDKPISMTGDL